MSGRVVENRPCGRCGAPDADPCGARWLCEDCREDQRTAMEGPL